MLLWMMWNVKIIFKKWILFYWYFFLQIFSFKYLHASSGIITTLKMRNHIKKFSACGGLPVFFLYLYSIRSITTRIRELLVRPGKNSLADGRQKINFELPKGEAEGKTWKGEERMIVERIVTVSRIYSLIISITKYYFHLTNLETKMFIIWKRNFPFLVFIIPYFLETSVFRRFPCKIRPKMEYPKMQDVVVDAPLNIFWQKKQVFCKFCWFYFSNFWSRSSLFLHTRQWRGLRVLQTTRNNFIKIPRHKPHIWFRFAHCQALRIE